MTTRRPRLQIRPNLGPRLGPPGPKHRPAIPNSPRREMRSPEPAMKSPTRSRKISLSSEEESGHKLPVNKRETRSPVKSPVKSPSSVNTLKNDKPSKNKLKGPQRLFSNVLNVLREKEKSTAKESEQVCESEESSGGDLNTHKLPVDDIETTKPTLRLLRTKKKLGVSDAANVCKADENTEVPKLTEPNTLKTDVKTEKNKGQQKSDLGKEIKDSAITNDICKSPDVKISRFQKKTTLNVRGSPKINESPSKTAVSREPGPKSASNQGPLDTTDSKTGNSAVEKEPKTKVFRSRFPKARPNLANAGRPKARSVVEPLVKPSDKKEAWSNDSLLEAETVPEPPTLEIYSPENIEPSKEETFRQSQSPGKKEGKRTAADHLSNESIASLPGSTTPKRSRASSISTSEASVKAKKRKMPVITSWDVVDRCKMTMRDLIYWNPSSNPMKASPEKKKEVVIAEAATPTKEPDLPPATQTPNVLPASPSDPQQTLDVEGVPGQEDDDDGMPVPQVKIGPDGNIILNEASLVVENPDSGRKSSDGEVINETDTCVSYASYRKKIASRRWSETETLKFYRILSYVGTDFTLMQKLFPKRTHRELKNKFKTEEKRNRLLIDKAMRATKSIDKALFQNIDEEEEVVQKPKKKKRASRKLKPKTSPPSLATKKPRIRKHRKNINYYEDSDSEIEEARQRRQTMLASPTDGVNQRVKRTTDINQSPVSTTTHFRPWTETGVAVPGGMLYASEESSRPGAVVCDGEVSCDDESIVCDDTDAVKSTIPTENGSASPATQEMVCQSGDKSDTNIPSGDGIAHHANELSTGREPVELFEEDSCHSRLVVDEMDVETRDDSEIVYDSDKDDSSQQVKEFPNNQFIVYNNCDVDMEVNSSHPGNESISEGISEGIVETETAAEDSAASAQVSVGDGKFITIPKVGGSECYVLVTVLPADQTGESVMHVYKLNPSGDAAAAGVEQAGTGTDADKSEKDQTSSEEHSELKTEKVEPDGIQPLQSVNFVQEEVQKNVDLFSNFAVVSHSVSQSLHGYTQMEDSGSSPLQCSLENDNSKTAFNILASPNHSTSDSDPVGKRQRRTSSMCTGSQSDSSDGLCDEPLVDLSVPRKQLRNSFSEERSMSPLIIVPDEVESELTIKTKGIKTPRQKADFTRIRGRSNATPVQTQAELEVIEIDDSTSK